MWSVCDPPDRGYSVEVWDLIVVYAENCRKKEVGDKQLTPFLLSHVDSTLPLRPGGDGFDSLNFAASASACIPELSVEPPLLPGSLSLSEAAELKANSDDQLDEGHHS